MEDQYEGKKKMKYLKYPVLFDIDGAMIITDRPFFINCPNKHGGVGNLCVYPIGGAIWIKHRPVKVQGAVRIHFANVLAVYVCKDPEDWLLLVPDSKLEQWKLICKVTKSTKEATEYPYKKWFSEAALIRAWSK